MAFEYSTITLFLELALSQSSHTLVVPALLVRPLTILSSSCSRKLALRLLLRRLSKRFSPILERPLVQEWFPASVLVSSELISVTVSEFSIVTPLADNPSRRPSTSLSSRVGMPCLPLSKPR
ncbi:hypothetical protein BHE90_016484 [Fusarium euwallaceae]|uniref:Uncharacterized protein n=2 Tax=Fusarium solani species complex TaxID=232080 RepID=A0A3M2RXX1_9HYPO|nr:hypothetical protein CDV36_010591 [Fusarium kuroshium]RTE69139.1 hypothetical protein BHE90_016484 [Fusarium euwallaceae]